jgi:catechol 2,3-dioxygenase-like lactoylglutathione lyase family enzyme
MLGPANIVAFLATSNPEMAREFYEDILGLPCADEQYALVLEVGGIQVRIQKLDNVTPPTGTALGFQVERIEPVVQRLFNRGVEFEKFDHLDQDFLGIWTAGSGAKVAWFKDPAGNRLSLSEPAAGSEP